MIRILGIDPGSQRTGIGVIDVAADGELGQRPPALGERIERGLGFGR